MPVIRLKDETAKRVTIGFNKIFKENSHPAKKLASSASWDFKIQVILDELDWVKEN